MSQQAIERVAAACPKSQYKDDRHSWHGIAGPSTVSSMFDGLRYYVKKCFYCDLVVVLSGKISSWNDPPRIPDTIHAAFYDERPTV